MGLENHSTVVVKLGGSLLNGDLSVFWKQIRMLQEEHSVVLVHGGGPQATEMARRLDHTPTLVEGRRVTGDLDLSIVLWAMRGELNAKLSASAHAAGVLAVGISGADGGLISVTKRPPWRINGQQVDFGWVGDIVSIRTGAVDCLLNAGFVPVIAPMGIDEGGQIYNVNADTVASELAAALQAESLFLATDTGGLYRDPNAADAVLTRCDRDQYENGVEDGWISGGMRVKMQVAFEALEAGVRRVFIVGPDDLVTRWAATEVVVSTVVEARI